MIDLARASQGPSNCNSKQYAYFFGYLETPGAPSVSESLIHSLPRFIICRDGMKLSQDDEMFIVNKILMYHPEKEKKMAGQGNYIMVSTKQLIFAWE